MPEGHQHVGSGTNQPGEKRYFRSCNCRPEHDGVDPQTEYVKQTNLHHGREKLRGQQGHDQSQRDRESPQAFAEMHGLTAHSASALAFDLLRQFCGGSAAHHHA